ncbi:MAG: chemotaxis protein CheB [Gammaproteobacteria bacterium]|nr:chemotaxis protein CheB [Gammaproteobacteria bacterium]
MADTSNSAPRIAIVSASERQRLNLGVILGRNGLQVVLNQSPFNGFLSLACARKAEALLIDLDAEAVFNDELLTSLLEQDSLPILLNDSAATRMDAGIQNGYWGRQLARKLTDMAHEVRQRPAASVAPASAPNQHRNSNSPDADTVATQVWVLGASIGGPQALKRFMAALPPGLPLAFVLAQHIGTNFLELLARQLDQISTFRVLPAQAGHLLCRQQMVLAPVDEEMDIDASGRIVCTPATDNGVLYRPSIDAVLMNVARRYGKRSGAIIFSGMGNDGAEGVRAMAAQGAEVWAQDAASCLVSSMPDQVRQTGVVSFSGTPEALAQRLAQLHPAQPAAARRLLHTPGQTGLTA